MSANPALTVPAVLAPDRPIERLRPRVISFAMLVLPLVLLLFIFKYFRLEQPLFFSMACLAFGGFAIAYWLALRSKQHFVTALSLASAFILLGPAVAGILIAVGLTLFAIVRSDLKFLWKVIVLVG